MISAVLFAVLLVAIAAASLYSPTLGTRFWSRRRDRASLPLARRHVIEYMWDGVVIANADGAILDANPAAERILGLPGERIRSQALRSVLSALVRQADRAQVESWSRSLAFFLSPQAAPTPCGAWMPKTPEMPWVYAMFCREAFAGLALTCVSRRN